jgi:hypothetical protein
MKNTNTANIFDTDLVEIIFRYNLLNRNRILTFEQKYLPTKITNISFYFLSNLQKIFPFCRQLFLYNKLRLTS